MSCGPTSYVRALILLSSLVLSATSATANVLSLADYESFHSFNLKLRPIADELAGLIGNPPMPGGMSKSGLEAATTTQNCMIRLIGNFDAFEVRVDKIGTLVGLAAKMADSRDESLVIALLNIVAPVFLEDMKALRQILNANKNRCSQDGATVAKIQEISRIYNEADALVATIVKKIGAKPN